MATDTHRRPMRADARRNYERLLEAARETFSERGADASLDDIARRAGVGPGTLYRHFPNREALLGAVLRDWVEALRGESDALLSSPSPADALDTWLHRLLRHVSIYRGLSAALVTGVVHDSALADACAPIHDLGAALLERAQRAGVVRPDVTSAEMHRLVHAVEIATEPLADREAVADRMLAVVGDGLRT